MRRPNRSELLHFCAVFFIPALLTLPRFWNTFVYDDNTVIERGDFIHDMRNLGRAFTSHAMVASTLDSAVGLVPLDTYRPISIASFFWDSALSGRDPWAYHLTNLLVHSLNCVVFLALLSRLVPSAGLRLQALMALCFGLSPWLSEAHVFINGRSDLFIVLFLLVAMLLHRSSLETGSLPRALAAALAGFAALLSKETAVLALPFVVLMPTPSPASWRRRMLLAAPISVAFIAYLYVRAEVLRGLRTNAGLEHVLEALRNLPLLWLDTLVYTWLPTPYALRNLRDDYANASSIHFVAALLALGATIVLIAMAVRRGRPVLAWSLGLALATISPAIMISTELWQGFGRYLYLPATGIFTSLTILLSHLDATQAVGRLRPAMRAVPYALAVASGVLLVDATLGFRDDRTLFVRALARAPEQPWTEGSLGLVYSHEDRCDLAIPLLRDADRRQPDEPRYASELAQCLIKLKAFDKAYEIARRGQARFRGTRAEARFLIAEFLTLPRGHPRARILMERCLQVYPERPDCIEGLSIVLAEQAHSAAEVP